MGIEISLTLVDADEYRSLVNDLDAIGLSELHELRNALARESFKLNRALAREFLEIVDHAVANYDEDEDEATDSATDELLAREIGRRRKEVWYLGYRLYDSTLSDAAKALVALEPVQMILSGTGFDMPLPARGAEENDGWGIWGAWSPKALERCRPAVDRFEQLADVERFADTLESATGARGSGATAKRNALRNAKLLRAWVADKSEWEMWQQIRSAVRAAVSTGGCLVVAGS